MNRSRMDTPTIVVDALTAAFTAAAAVAAWRAAAITGREAREREKPFVAVGILRLETESRSVIVPLKNLGLGPALQVAIELSEGGVAFATRLGPGLAPMEAEEWRLFVDKQRTSMPTVLKISVHGSATDAAGVRHPLHLFGVGAAATLPAACPPPLDITVLMRGCSKCSLGRSSSDGRVLPVGGL